MNHLSFYLRHFYSDISQKNINKIYDIKFPIKLHSKPYFFQANCYTVK